MKKCWKSVNEKALDFFQKVKKCGSQSENVFENMFLKMWKNVLDIFSQKKNLKKMSQQKEVFLTKNNSSCSQRI